MAFIDKDKISRAANSFDYLLINCLIDPDKTSNAFIFVVYLALRIFLCVFEFDPAQKGEVPPETNM